MKIQINRGQVQARVTGAWERGLHMLSSEILADCNEYCKKDQNSLIMSSIVHSELGSGKLVWQTPYARRQYWDIRTSLTPGRTWKWCEAAKQRHLARWENLAQRAVDMNL